jgi:CRP-like cAMP-binding protein
MQTYINNNLSSTKPAIENLLIAALSLKAGQLIEQRLDLVRLKRRQFIYCESSNENCIYFPESCVISESRSLEDGRTLELSLIGREGAVGLLEMFFEGSDSPPVRQVVEAGLAYRISKTELRKMLREDDLLRKSLIPYVNTYLRFLSQQSACSFFHSARQRLCLRLLMIYERTASLKINATHEELAQALGVFRPTITNLSHGMRDDGLVVNTRGKFKIKDLEKLGSEACECYKPLWPKKVLAGAA